MFNLLSRHNMNVTMLMKVKQKFLRIKFEVSPFSYKNYKTKSIIFEAKLLVQIGDNS
jgi:hypothetical protein